MHGPAGNVELVVGALGSSIARGRYSALVTETAIAAPLDTAEKAVSSSVTFLSGFLVGALIFEAAKALAVTNGSQLRESFSKIDEQVRHAFHPFDHREAAAKFGRELRDGEDPLGAALESALAVPLDQVVRGVKAISVESPIELVEKLARAIGRPDLAHQARTAYEGLLAFVRRNDPEATEVIRIVGGKYQQGHLALAEAATLLGLSESDTVFELEVHGYARPQDVFALDDQARAKALAEARADRVRRGGKPQPDAQAIDRDVIASERIEGVDARPWMRGR